jgi:diguanylate cyclase (GGDEF)-like protein/PAS domain S-box-containing protein
MPNSMLRQTLAGGLRVKRWLLLGPFFSLGLVLLVLWALVAWFVLIYPQRLIRDAQHDLINTSLNTAHATDGVLREAGGALRTLDLMLLTRKNSASSADATVNLLVDQLREGSRGLTDVMLANTDGRLWRIPSATGEPYAHISPTLFLAALTRPGAPSVVVGPPLQLRPQSRPQIPLAIRLGVEAGEVNAAVALVDAEILSHLYRGALQRRTMAIALVRNDGVLLLREPALPTLVGRNVREGHPERAMPANAPTSGLFSTGVAALDGRDRVISYESLRDFPLRVFVSMERDHILGGYLPQRRAILGFSVLVSLVALGMLTWLTGQQKLNRLREAEREATADASPLGLFRCDLDGRVVYANETALRMLDLVPPGLGWDWLQALPEAQREAAQRDWQARMAGDQSFDLVRRLRRRDGSQMLVSLRCRPMSIKGRVVAHVGNLADITQQAQQQRTARMLSAIIDQAPDYVAQVDAAGQVIYLNPSARRRLGLAPDADLQGMYHTNFFRTEGQRRYQREILPAALRDGHWHGRAAVLTRSGESVPVDCTLLLHRNERGRIETYSWLLNDITAELQAEQERERSMAVMGAMAQSAAVMVLAMDLHQQVLFCNRRFEERFELAHRAWLGCDTRSLLGEERYRQVRPLILAAMQGEDGVIELEETLGDGRSGARHVEVNFTPLRNEQQQIIGAFSVARDITEAKQTQQRLLQASHTDPLTELLNRAGFAERIQTLLPQSAERGELVALLYLDLDRFKPVNDQHGHPVGDALLKAVAGRLRHALRPQDLVARLGGDEFAVFLPQLARAGDAQVVGDKLVQTLTTPFRIGELELQIGTSVGFCVEWAAQAEIDHLVTQADAQLYQAKRAGRGRAQGQSVVTPPPDAAGL